MLRVAIYARVSSEQQAQQQTIGSQIAALKQRVQEDGHVLLPQDIYVDDGCSGSTLVRPALEKLRDRIAEGVVDLLYVHSPDRLARKYAYQVVLLEEFRARSVKVTFVQGPTGQSAEDELLVQVQGVIAEYERAKIVERGRRGRVFCARQGHVSALANAPFGYMYSAKSATSNARYQIVLHEARVVRTIFEALVREHKSIDRIVRTLNESGVRSRRGHHWTRSTVGGILRNPAYMGKAAFGKTRTVERVSSRSRPLRGKSFLSNKAQIRQPTEEWIFIDVPPIVSVELFQAASEQLARNRQLSRRLAREGRYLLQGLSVCGNCGYAWTGTTSSPKQKVPLSYYRCLGRSGSRWPGGQVCHVRPVRADLLDEYVWRSVCELLQEPERLKQEWLRRMGDKRAAKELDAQRDDAAQLLATQERILKRLIDAYEAGAVSLSDLKQRTQVVRDRIARARRELLTAQENLDNQSQLRALITRLEDFGARVSTRLPQLTWQDRQRLVRTLISKVEITDDGATIVYRLSASGTPPSRPPGDAGTSGGTKSYRLRPGLLQAKMDR